MNKDIIKNLIQSVEQMSIGAKKEFENDLENANISLEEYEEMPISRFSSANYFEGYQDASNQVLMFLNNILKKESKTWQN